jgi:hypothetical protein
MDKILYWWLLKQLKYAGGGVKCSKVQKVCVWYPCTYKIQDNHTIGSP